MSRRFIPPLKPIPQIIQPRYIPQQYEYSSTSDESDDYSTNEQTEDSSDDSSEEECYQRCYKPCFNQY